MVEELKGRVDSEGEGLKVTENTGSSRSICFSRSKGKANV